MSAEMPRANVAFTTVSAGVLPSRQNTPGLELVLGVQVGSEPRLSLGLHNGGSWSAITPSTRVVPLSSRPAERLSVFTRCMTGRRRPELDGFALMGYVHGYTANPLPALREGWQTRITTAGRPIAGTPLVLIDRTQRPIEGMISLGSGQILGVHRGRLIICPVMSLIRLYSAAGIAQVISFAAKP